MQDEEHEPIIPVAELADGSKALSREKAKKIVKWPAITLMTLSAIWIPVIMVYTGWLVLKSMTAARKLAQDAPDALVDMTQETQTVTMSVLIATGIVFVAFNLIVFQGASKMRELKNIQVAWLAAILACVPICGPGYVASLPFGIWAIVALCNPDVRREFR